jgi:hypothetical protein
MVGTHERKQSMKCTATTTAGNPCKLNSINGGVVCHKHGGSAPQVKAKADIRAEVMKWTLGDAVDDPGEILLRMITQSRIRVDGYSLLIEEKVADGKEKFGDDFTLESLLVGSTFGEFGNKTGEYIRGLVALEAQERDRLVGFAAKAIAAGLAERQVRIAERQGEMLAVLMRAIAGDPALALTQTQREAMPGVLRAHITSVIEP